MTHETPDKAPWICGYCETGACKRCTHDSGALIESAAERCACPHVPLPRETVQTLAVPVPHFLHLGKHDTAARILRSAIANLRTGAPVGGSGVCDGIADLLDSVAAALADGAVQSMVPIAAHNRALAALSEHDLAMHHAYRPDAVAEIAVHLGSHENWDEIVKWCGGRIESTQDPSGEYSSVLILPDGQVAWETSWVTLDHAGVFRVRPIVEGPPTPPQLLEGASSS